MKSRNVIVAAIVVGIFSMTSGAMTSGAMTSGAMGAQCTGSVCIDVHADPTTGKVVIDATKIIPGIIPSSTPTAAPKAPVKPAKKPVTALAPKPVVKRTVNPTPRPYVRHVPYVYHPPKPKPAKTISTPTPVAAVNLADQITQLLPLRNIYVEPSGGAIASIPTYFWTDTNSIFNTATTILGVGVGVTLNPSFTWNFGDGASMTLDHPGAPLPDKSVGHVYSKAGRYNVTLIVSWLGSWAAGGYSYPVIGGAIVQSYSTNLTVLPAPTRFGN
jgi:hypothetical protein